MSDDKLHYVVVTGIIIKKGKYLIAKRSEEESAFSGLWTVPGGKLEKSDYVFTSRDTADHWYNVLRKSLVREIREEVGLEVKNIDYLLSLSYLRSDGRPTLIVSLYCDYKSGEVELSDELVDHEWVSVEELDDYEFVPGLQEEIELVHKEIHGEESQGWKGRYDSADDESVRDGK